MGDEDTAVCSRRSLPGWQGEGRRLGESPQVERSIHSRGSVDLHGLLYLSNPPLTPNKKNLLVPRRSADVLGNRPPFRLSLQKSNFPQDKGSQKKRTASLVCCIDRALETWFNLSGPCLHGPCPSPQLREPRTPSQCAKHRGEGNLAVHSWRVSPGCETR